MTTARKQRRPDDLALMHESGAGDWLRVGQIGSAYGIKGWVRIRHFTESAESLLALDGWYLDTGRGAQREPLRLAEGRVQGKGIIAQLEGYTDRNAAETLRGKAIWVREAQLPELGEDEYYWRDLVGLQVVNDYTGAETLLGVVDHLLETGANDVLVVKHCPGSVDERERLIPYLPESVVREVQPDRGRVLVHWHPDD